MSTPATTTPATRRLLRGGAAVALLTASHTLTDALVGMFAALLPTLQERLALTEWWSASSRQAGPSVLPWGP